MQDFVVQVISNDRLQLCGSTCDAHILSHFEGLFGSGGAGSNRANNAQQQGCTQDQCKPSLLEDVLTTHQNNHTDHRSDGCHTVDHQGDVAGIRRAVIIAVGGSGRGLGSGRCRGGGDLGHVNGQAILISSLRVGSQIHTVRYQRTGGEGNAGRNDQLRANVVHTGIAILYDQRNIHGLTCGIVSLVSGQLSRHAVLCAGGGKGGGAEHENRQQESQGKENR